MDYTLRKILSFTIFLKYITFHDTSLLLMFVNLT